MISNDVIRKTNRVSNGKGIRNRLENLTKLFAEIPTALSQFLSKSISFFNSNHSKYYWRLHRNTQTTI